MIWNETKECMSRDEMTNLQSARLVKLVDYVYHNVEFYRKKMQAIDLMPGDIKSLEDITKLPFMTKDDLRDNYPFGLFAVPNSEIVRIHASSGTTIFICLLSFVLTSNAPKIAMTLLTGQPQLSMGELVQAAATFGAGAMAGKNLASTVASPAMAQAKKKAHEWGEQRGAASSARLKQENAMRADFAQSRGIDTTTRAGRKELNSQWKEYKNSDAGSEIKSKLNSVGNSAKEDVKLRQKAEYEKNGGMAGSAGRLLAHYGGAFINPKQS